MRLLILRVNIWDGKKRDDLLAPTALEETASVLSNEEKVGMVYTNYQVIDERRMVKGLGKRCQIPYSRDGLLLNFMT